MGIVKEYKCVADKGISMQKIIEKRIFEYCEKYHMFENGDGVVLGVSGGADSVCLLFALYELQTKWNLHLHVVHVNHGIRSDAAEDAAYVRQLCEERGIPFYLFEVSVEELARERGCSTEEAGRQVRYEAFAQVMQEQKCQKIAVAHNMNDRAETMLFHLFRGTGLTGLVGIRPARGELVRPILCLSRAAIEDFLQARGIEYRHDSTNDTDDYTRNKIRHHILPYTEQEIVQGTVGNMTRTADILAETEQYIEEQVQIARENCVTELLGEIPGFLLQLEAFSRLHEFLKKRLVLDLLKELSPKHKDIAAIHVEDVCLLTEREGNREIHLPYGIRARRQYGELFLERPDSYYTSYGFEDLVIQPGEITEEEKVFPLGGGRRICLKSIDLAKNPINLQDIPENQYTKWFDYDKIIGCLTLRNRRAGDYLTMRRGEALQHKKVKDYMITEKIPKISREQIPLLAEGEHILWLVGYRISEYYKVDENTKRILQVRFTQSNKITER